MIRTTLKALITWSMQYTCILKYSVKINLRILYSSFHILNFSNLNNRIFMMRSKSVIENSFGPFYTSMTSRRGYIFTRVCLCVCVCVCVCVCLSVSLSVCLSVCPDFLLTNFQPNGWTDLDAVAYRTGSKPIEIGDFGSKVKVTVT